MIVVLIFVYLISFGISLALLIETFIMFRNIKDIKFLIEEQNENIEALVKLGIVNNRNN